MSLRLSWVVLAALLGSCSLLEKLTEQEFKVTADFKVDAAGTKFPQWPIADTVCSAPTQCCPSTVIVAECDRLREVLRCEADRCGARVPVGLFQTVDLRGQISVLRDATSLSDVRVGDVWLEVGEGKNTLSIAMPRISVYLAPQDVTDTAGAGAELVGTLPALQQGQTGEIDLELTPTGRDLLASFLTKSGSPFNLIVKAEIVLGPGQQVMGALDAKLAIQAKAKINL